MTERPIRRVPRERREDRSASRLGTAWVCADRPIARPPGGSALVAESAVPLLHRFDAEPVLVMLAGDHPRATASLLAAADAGARVYVVAPPGWGDGKSDPGLASRKNATVFVRRVPDVPVSGFASGGIAHVWLGASRGAAPWRLQLDTAQTAAFRQVFLWLFWHHAIDEAWTGSGALAFRPAGERPFDVPELPRQARVRLVAPAASLDVGRRGAWVNLNAGEPPTEGPRRIWIAPSGGQHPQLSRLHRSGGEVVGGQLDLPDLVVDDAAGSALLSGERWRMWIDLGPAQVADARCILSAEAPWRFGVDVSIGDASHRDARFWLDSAAAAEPLVAEQHLPIGDVQADSLAATEETEPRTWPTPQPLALQARYSWTNIPPRVPSGTEEDSLVERWRKVDLDYTTRLTRVRTEVGTAGDHRGRIVEAFSRLVSEMMGFERTGADLGRELSELERTRPSTVGPGGAPALLQRVEVAEKQARELQTDLNKAEQKARLEAERAKQEEEWRIRVEKAQHEGAAREAVLNECERKRHEIASALSALEADLKTADDKSQRDMLARQKKLSDELILLNRDIPRLKGEVTDMKRSANELFTFQPPAVGGQKPGAMVGTRFVPAGIPARPVEAVPTEALPEVGKLRTLKGVRYLVIDRWEDLFAGDAAASRLKARLVAPEGT